MEFSQSEILRLIHNVSYAMVAKESKKEVVEEVDQNLLGKLCDIYKKITC